MQLEQLAQKLPRLAAQPELVAAQGEALSVSPIRIPGYVSPTVTVLDWPANAPVLLVEAAGAVGKSAAAAALANELRWPLIRAERAQVGDYTLLGLLQDAAGPTSTLIRDIALAEAGVVIDSLDEAQLRAGSENFLAFVTNIIKVSGSQILPDQRPPSIVLFSRSDAAELIELAFADQDVPLARARLDFFDLNQARDFLEAYMRLRFEETERADYNIPRVAPRPYAKLRDGRMNQIARLLLARQDVSVRSDWKKVQDFLGYAPVLIALAESLAVTNPAAQALQLDATDEGQLLRDIVDFILRREQAKFAEHLSAKLQALLPATVDQDIQGHALYTPREQAIRLLSYVSGVQLRTSLPGALPQHVRSQYEHAVENFLPDHPFINNRKFASIVFGDFVCSVATTNVDAQLALGDDPHLLFNDVGPFYTRFLGQDRDGNGRVEIPESSIESVMWSWVQEGELAGTSETYTRLILADAVSTLICSHENEGDESIVEFDIGNLTGGLSLKRPLRNTTIVTDFGLLLGTRGGYWQVGPDVLILAAELVVEAETLRVVGRDVRLGGDSILANYLTKIESGEESLAIYVESPPSRLRQYVRKLEYDRFSVPYQVYVDLRSIFGAFKSTIHGLSAHGERLENKIVKGSDCRQRLLQQLIEAGIVSRSGGWYLLDVNALNRVGFGLQDLRTGEPSPAVLAFLVRGGHGERIMKEI